jgi:hypothetical protein
VIIDKEYPNLGVDIHTEFIQAGIWKNAEA